MCHVSHVICHVSLVKGHMAYVTCHMSQFFFLPFSDNGLELVDGGSVINKDLSEGKADLPFSNKMGRSAYQPLYI